MNDKRISSEIQKKLLVEMLKYIDDICRKNDIKYSLIGGTLIGAIRHKGFIPWDDDIDIILDYRNYKKLLSILKRENNSQYRIFIPMETEGYPLQFAKLIHSKTEVKEKGMLKQIAGYGLFLDVFCYNNIPNELNKRKKFYKKLKFLNNSLVQVPLDYKNPSFNKKVLRFLKNCANEIIGYKFFLKKDLEHFNKFAEKETDFVVSNNPVNCFETDVQESKYIKEFIDVKFENLKVMCYKNYDVILKKYFGDYMKLPPKNKRVTHGLDVFWKD